MERPQSSAVFKVDGAQSVPFMSDQYSLSVHGRKCTCICKLDIDQHIIAAVAGVAAREPFPELEAADAQRFTSAEPRQVR